MIAGVAGLKAHQSKLDVIGNNIANVNTWGFKSYSYNFQDAMYSNSISSTGGSTVAGAAGGHNASQVGYGSTLSSISTEFNTGAPSPSSNNMDCMIDGTGFFLVGNMVNGTFDPAPLDDPVQPSLSPHTLRPRLLAHGPAPESG